MRRLLALLTLTACLLLASASAAFADAEVEIGDDGLAPETVEVDVREPIVWTNTTDGEVSLVGEDPAWESGPIAPGATFSIEITQAGTYQYGSEDGALAGEIVVGEGPDEQGTEAGEPVDGAGEDDVVKQDPDGEAGLPETGIAPMVPGALSVLLIAFGGGLLYLTEPRRRLT